MQRTASTKIGLGLAGALTLSLALAPAAFANGAPTEEIPVEDVSEQAPFLDLMYAAPHMNLAPGATTTVVIAQTVPASYTLASSMSNGAKCFAPYEAPAADHTKSGGESDADLVVRTIVSTGIDANGNGIDDWYDGLADENGVVACKIKATDEYGNLDWKYIYITVGLPKTPAGDDFDTGATTTVVTDPPTTTQPATTAPSVTDPVTPASATTTPVVAQVTVAPTATVATATLPRTGTATWIEVALGSALAAAGAAMVTFSRRRAVIAEARSND